MLTVVDTNNSCSQRNSFGCPLHSWCCKHLLSVKMISHTQGVLSRDSAGFSTSTYFRKSGGCTPSTGRHIQPSSEDSFCVRREHAWSFTKKSAGLTTSKKRKLVLGDLLMIKQASDFEIYQQMDIRIEPWRFVTHATLVQHLRA